jgi:hypothetical protein
MVRKAHDPAVARRYAELGQQWRQLADQIEGKASQGATGACEVEPGLTGPVAARGLATLDSNAPKRPQE